MDGKIFFLTRDEFDAALLAFLLLLLLLLRDEIERALRYIQRN
jgi:hypothetical protein